MGPEKGRDDTQKNGNGKYLDIPENGFKLAQPEKEKFLSKTEADYEEEEDVEEELLPEERCGFFCFTPDFMQKFRNMRAFLAAYMICGMAGGMYFAYWNMTLSSIEKRFQIPSQTTGMLTAINDISHIMVVLVVAHFCGKGHRPRWMFVGGFIVGLAVMTFGAAELFAKKWDVGGLTSVSLNSSAPKVDRELCLTADMAALTADKCDAKSQADRNDILLPIIVLATAQILLGIGTTAPIVLAMPFIDDNVKTKNSPIYFALGLCGRFVGPTVGVVLGSFCLSTYVDLTSPKIAQNDPRWMGAWWLGFVVIGATISLTSFMYLCFPRSLTRKKPQKRFQRIASEVSQKSQKSGTSSVQNGLKTQLSTMPRDIKRLLSNKIFVCRLLNDCIDMLVISGYLNFASKYIEFHFRISPAEAGRYNGLSNMLAMATGVATGGLIIRKFKWQPKHVAMTVLICSFLTGICYFFLMMIRCEPRTLHSSVLDNGMLSVDTDCSKSCNCAGKPFSPVCHLDTQMNYYSPCQAGCTKSFRKDGSSYYTNCGCLALNSTYSTPTPFPLLLEGNSSFSALAGHNSSHSAHDTVKRGYCSGDCGNFWIYIIISGLFRFVLMLPISGNQMLTFRIIEPDLKALSKGLETCAASLFAFIPGPIIMGAIIDSTCKLWNTLSCGKTGACLVYDLDALRIKMHLYVGIVKTLACLMDVYVYFKVKDMKFEREEIAEVEQADLEETLPTGSVRDLTAHN